MHWSKRYGLSFTVNKKWSSDFRLWVVEFATRYPNLMKTGDPWLLPPHVVEMVHTYLLFWWHTLWQLRKALNKQSWQHKQKCHTISPDINKQTNNNIMQKTRVYSWSLKSNTKLSPRHPQWSHYCERSQPPMRKGSLKKRIGCFFRIPLFLGKWCGVATYFLYQKKKN